MRPRGTKPGGPPAWTADVAKGVIRKIAAARCQRKRDDLAQTDTRLAVVEKACAALRGRGSIHKYLQLRKEYRDLVQHHDHTAGDKWVQPILDRARPLMNPHAGSSKRQYIQAVFNAMFFADYGQVQMQDPDTCPRCRVDMVLHPNTSTIVCPACHESRYIIMCNADIVQPSSNQRYERSPLYRKFLMQFHADVQDPPDDVLSSIIHHLSRVHVLQSTKVKPTPVSAVLRKCGMQKYIAQVARITRVLNREPVAALPTDLIDRLVSRFEKVVKVFRRVKNLQRKKILSFEFLTKKFLILEGEPAMADMFSMHKTRAVLTIADRTLKQCCDILSRTDPMGWKLPWTM